MARRKAPPPQPAVLVAAIRQIESTYYVSEDSGENWRVEDEAILFLIGEIEDISPAQRRFLGRKIEMSFIRARSFRRNDAQPSTWPFLLPVQLRKNLCSLAAYLPADAFWALPEMISSKAVTDVEARFTKPSRGSGALLSVYFAPAKSMGTVA